jgi:hypothetical protein
MTLDLQYIILEAIYVMFMCEQSCVFSWSNKLNTIHQNNARNEEP